MRPRNKRSQTAVIILLALPVLLAVLGLGYDFSLHYYH